MSSTSEWTSEWPGTYVPILDCSEPQCNGREASRGALEGESFSRGRRPSNVFTVFSLVRTIVMLLKKSQCQNIENILIKDIRFRDNIVSRNGITMSIFKFQRVSRAPNRVNTVYGSPLGK